MTNIRPGIATIDVMLHTFRETCRQDADEIKVSSISESALKDKNNPILLSISFPLWRF